jgi:hypothetical protein
MSEPFDPYYKWLGIPPEDQPPDYYRLLAIRPFEDDADVIDAAAEQRMTLLRSRQTGPHAGASQKLLNEISAARACLLDHDRRRAYDTELKAAAETPMPEPVVQPAAVEPLSSPLDDLPVVDPAAVASPPAALPLVADTSRKYTSGRYAPPQTPAPWLVLLGVGGAALLLVVVVIGLSVGFRLLAGRSQQESDTAQLDPPRPRSRPPAPPTPPNTPAPNAPPTPNMSIDLLSQIDPARDSVNGEFRIEDGALLIPPVRAAHLEIPVSPPASYRLEVVVQRLTGTDSFQIGLVCGDGESMMIFDGFRPKVSGLNLLDQSTADRNRTRWPGEIFDNNDPHRIVCTVRPGEIHVTCDGETIVDWQGDPSRLQLHRRFIKVRNEHRLRISGWTSVYRVSELRLTELSDE